MGKEEQAVMKSISLDFSNKVVCVITGDQHGTKIEPELEMKKFIEHGFIPEKYCDHTSFTWNFENDTFAVNQDHELRNGAIMSENYFIPEYIIPFKGLGKRFKKFLNVLNYENIDIQSIFLEEL